MIFGGALFRDVMVNELVSLDQLPLSREFYPHWVLHAFRPCATSQLCLVNRYKVIFSIRPPLSSRLTVYVFPTYQVVNKTSPKAISSAIILIIDVVFSRTNSL